MRRVLLAGLLLPVLGARLEPQSRRPETGLQVSLVTWGEGEYIWEKFGHNALWFQDSSSGLDVAYNWGIFDFTQPGFLRRFLAGNPMYAVEEYPGTALVNWYIQQDRTTVVQRLALTPDQARRAYEFARNNATGSNRFYRYDYFLDNCSTRVRDVLDYALGGALKRATQATPDDTRTFRTETLRLLDDMKVAQLGVDIALGQPADRRLSAWDNMFVPMRMRDNVRDVRVPGADGRPVALVAAERVLHRTTQYAERADPPTLWVPYLIVGLLLAAEFGGVGRAARTTSSKLLERIFRVEIVVWSVLAGIVGLLVTLAWAATRHEFWYGNENLFVTNPLSLWLAILVAMSLGNARWTRPAAITAVVIALFSAVGLMLKGVPAFAQSNIPVLLLFLPPHFAIAYELRSRVSAERA